MEKHLAAVQDPKAVYQDKTCLLYSVSHNILLLIAMCSDVLDGVCPALGGACLQVCIDLSWECADHSCS